MNQTLLDQAANAHRAGRLDEAEKAYRAVLSTTPGQPDALALLGVLLSGKGDHQQAVTLIRQAVLRDPSAALFKFHLGNALAAANENGPAIAAFREALAQQPDFGEGWLNLCRVAERNNDYPASLAAGEKAVALMPGNHSAFMAYGVILSQLERHEEAERAFRRAIELRPDWADAWDNLGQAYFALNRLDESEAAYRKCVDLAGQTLPDEQMRTIDESKIGTRHWHLAQVELMKGDYRTGFGRYRCRFSADGGMKRPDYPQPYWRGEDISGKTILALDEVGHGDALMLARYVPLLREKGARVKFAVRPNLLPLFQGWQGADEVLSLEGSLGAFDIYAKIWDLPYDFGTTLENIPTKTYLPLLPPDNETRLEAPAGKKKIGVVWGGWSDKFFDKRRVPLAIFAQLFERKDCAFYSLTRDKNAADTALLPQLSVTDLAPRIAHFGAMTRFLGQMDLVITVDTATAHLAGGLGLKTWTLLAFAPDWRWHLNREDSIWYPSMRLFRQPKTGGWESVIARMKGELAHLI